MNFAYVLVSDSSDIYYEQFLVSLISLKHWNPDAKVLLACDDVTKSTLTDLRSRHEKYVDEVKVVEFPKDKGKHYRSRYLKTTLRELFVGDFLYLDTDTIVCDKIDESVFADDVMGVEDCHQKPEEHSGWKIFVEQIRKSGFSEKDITSYINSGVLWMKDCKNAHDFSALWHRLWLDGVDRGIPVDQPSLNESNKRMNCISLLSGEYNCQLSATLKFFHKAKILHCFATAVSNAKKGCFAFYFLNPDFYLDIKHRALTELDEQLIFDAKSAFDAGETIMLGKKDSDIYRGLSRTNLYGFVYCLFNSKRGRWLFDLLDCLIGKITSLFWKNK